ncbi:OmpA family protein [Sphingobacterium sp. N143]|uniref:OmpA family protein n=1 Tax=Sphingobacterium sp. N143 TaxID=2746727 RepID=UPI002574C6A4|nr:OmpA family protein [Sphingobacterium sp. N143]MDM1293206.1 OmpA family protein [Sphingobacterium sp. N143]
MENHLLKQAKDFFDDEVLAHMGQTLNQDKEQVKRGLDVVVPSLFLGLSQQSDSGIGISSILDQAKQHFSNFDLSELMGGGPVGTTAEVQAGESGQSTSGQLLTSIFGGGLETVLSTVAGYLGFNGESVKKLMGLSLPAIFSSLTNKGQNWDSSTISQVLQENKTAFAAAIPAGLGLGAFGKLFDGGAFSAPEEKLPEDIAVPTDAVKGSGVPPIPTPIDPATELAAHKEPLSLPRSDEGKAAVATGSSGGGGWWKILVALIILALLWFLFGKGCSSGKKEGATDTSVSQVQVDRTDTMLNGATNGAAGGVDRERLEVTLPTGVKLAAFKGGIEDQLVQFLKSDYQSLGEDSLKNTWFDFDYLNFETGTATVLPESEVQLSNLAEILKAFPAAHVKIGGYTDKTGNEDFNKTLSLNRANAVKDYLDKKGLSGQVTGAEGYGSQFAKYAADAPESDRILDRHVAVSVR